MKFSQGLNKSERLYKKLMELEVPSWARAQETIKKHAQSMAQKAVLVDSAPKTAQGQVLNQMSGSSGARPTSRWPGGQRKKLDTDTRGRDKTKAQAAPHSNKGGQSPGRSNSGARECWECNEVVTGDHYQADCPKRKKKDDEARSMTPYPWRVKSSSKDRNNATQQNKTFRRFHDYIGTGPWKLLVQG